MPNLVVNDLHSTEVVLQDLTNFPTDDDTSEFTVSSVTVRNYEIDENRHSTEVVPRTLTDVTIEDEKLRNGENEEESKRTDPAYIPTEIEQQENRQEEEFTPESRRR